MASWHWAILEPSGFRKPVIVWSKSIITCSCLPFSALQRCRLPGFGSHTPAPPISKTSLWKCVVLCSEMLLQVSSSCERSSCKKTIKEPKKLLESRSTTVAENSQRACENPRAVRTRLHLSMCQCLRNDCPAKIENSLLSWTPHKVSKPSAVNSPAFFRQPAGVGGIDLATFPKRH